MCNDCAQCVEIIVYLSDTKSTVLLPINIERQRSVQCQRCHNGSMNMEIKLSGFLIPKEALMLVVKLSITNKNT